MPVLRLTRPGLGPLVLLLISGCATERALFRPRERVLAESPDGHPAALYVLDDEGKSVGEVRIWSAGAWREDDDAQRTVIHLGLEIENRTGNQLTLDVDATDLRNVTANGEIGGLERLDLRGSPVVADGSVGRVEFLFGLPAGSRGPTDLDSFHAHWLLRGLNERDFEQMTPFRRDGRAVDDHPYWHGSFGFTYGWPYWGYPYPYYYWPRHPCNWYR